MPFNLTTLVIGWVLGGLTTSALIWYQRGSRPKSDPDYFRQIALSVIATAAVATLIRLGVYSTLSGNSGSVEFGVGWMIGGLLAAWFLTRTTRNK